MLSGEGSVLPRPVLKGPSAEETSNQPPDSALDRMAGFLKKGTERQ